MSHRNQLAIQLVTAWAGLVRETQPPMPKGQLLHHATHGPGVVGDPPGLLGLAQPRDPCHNDGIFVYIQPDVCGRLLHDLLLLNVALPWNQMTLDHMVTHVLATGAGQFIMSTAT